MVRERASTNARIHNCVKALYRAPFLHIVENGFIFFCVRDRGTHTHTHACSVTGFNLSLLALFSLIFCSIFATETGKVKKRVRVRAHANVRCEAENFHFIWLFISLYISLGSAQKIKQNCSVSFSSLSSLSRRSRRGSSSSGHNFLVGLNYGRKKSTHTHTHQYLSSVENRMHHVNQHTHSQIDQAYSFCSHLHLHRFSPFIHNTTFVSSFWHFIYFYAYCKRWINKRRRKQMYRCTHTHTARRRWSVEKRVARNSACAQAKDSRWWTMNARGTDNDTAIEAETKSRVAARQAKAKANSLVTTLSYGI